MNDALLITVILFAIFAAFWAGTFWLIAAMTGWRKLARYYAATNEPSGKKLSMQSARFGLFGGYNNCLTMVVADVGLYFRPWPMFRIGHPPLLIPWGDLHVLKVRESLFNKTVEVAVGNPPLVNIALPLKVLDAAASLRSPPDAPPRRSVSEEI